MVVDTTPLLFWYVYFDWLDVGEVAEWLKAAVLKTVMGREAHLEFESLPLRHSSLR